MGAVISKFWNRGRCSSPNDSSPDLARTKDRAPTPGKREEEKRDVG